VSDPTNSPIKSYRIPAGNVWANLWKITAAIAALGIVVAIAGFATQSDRFGFSYLFAFITVFTLWLGSVFFTLIQHLTAAGWSASVRRASEFFVSGVVVLPFLFLPLLTQTSTLYPWWNADHSGVAEAQDHNAPTQPGSHESSRNAGHDVHGAAPGVGHDAPGAAHGGGAHQHGGHVRAAGQIDHHAPHHQLEQELLAKKQGYLNKGFWYVRAIVYFLLWLWIGLRLFGLSTQQDASGDKQLTVKLARFAAPATAIYALSLTLAAIDWVMSMEPAWYSTMYGVRFFASGAVTSFAAVIVVTMGWKRAGLVGNEINTEHFHDLGKLMFGFLIFWAYTTFSEFFLIWYAAIPEEVVYFHRRWDDQTWRLLSCAVVGLKFIFPFFFTMSRNIKRNNKAIVFGASWLLGIHLIEMYYLIMPYYRPFEPIQFGGIWLELGCVMATVGVYLTWVLRNMTKHSLIAVGDPRLSRALNHVNV
jgi:hypothetical protein